MRKKLDYFWPRAAVKVTGIVFLLQVMFEVTGVFVRKPGFEWVTTACGVAFLVACLYASVVISINVVRERA